MNTITIGGPRPWQQRSLTQILAVLAGFLPVYGFALWSQLGGNAITLRELFLYPLLLGGGNVLAICLLLRFVCGKRLATLQLRPGTWYRDTAAGLILCFLALGLNLFQVAVQNRLLPGPPRPPAEELMTLFRGIANDPLLIAFWLGPVLWIGVAGFEELTRTFALNCLWTVWSRPGARRVVLLITAVLFGLVHQYQGHLAVIFIGLQGLLYGWYYLRFGRVWPLIIAHALYDSFQVIQLVMVFSKM